MRIYNAIIAALFSITTLLAQAESTLPPTADLIFFNGKIYTVNEQQPWAEAVAVKNGEIVAVGNLADINSWRGKSTKQQDLQGKMLLPGFIDSHAHPVMGGAYVRSLSLDTFASPKQWLKQVSDYAKKKPDDKVLFGYGFLASAFGPEGPTSAMLDTVVSDRPVYLMDEGFHGAWGNTKALELLKIDKNT